MNLINYKHLKEVDVMLNLHSVLSQSSNGTYYQTHEPIIERYLLPDTRLYGYIWKVYGVDFFHCVFSA